MSDRRLRRLVLPSVIPLWPVAGHDALATRCTLVGDILRRFWQTDARTATARSRRTRDRRCANQGVAMLPHRWGWQWRYPNTRE